MDGTGPEPKRQRLGEYNGTQRQQASIAPPHSHNGILPPPQQHTYQPPSQPPPPPSPYDVGPHENRSLPDPTPHAYVQAHSASGQNTPVRDQRFHPEPNYSRRSSTSARSPDEHHPYAPGRSMSISTTADGQHYPPAQQYAIDSAGHLPAYPPTDGPPNGNVHHGLPMHPYDQSQGYPPGHPLDYAHSPVTAGPHPYGAVPYGPQYGGPGRPLKKGNRATQACDVCRTRKAKCDEGRPECGFCVENNMRCNYQSVAPAKADRANQQIIDQLTSHKDDMKALKEDWGGRFDRIERMLLDITNGREAANEIVDRKPSMLQLESPKRGVTGDRKGPPSVALQKPVIKEQAADTSPNGSYAVSGTDSTGTDPVTNGTNAIYIEHDTAAQKLFRWPSIKALLRKSKKLDFSDRAEDYVMNFEMNKGVLRLYGKGRQMRDTGEGYTTSASVSSPATSSISGPSDESSEGRSPSSSPENLWGFGFMSASSPEPRPVNDIGGLNSDNTLRLDHITMKTLLGSYLDNIHILHPFLDERELSSKVDHFMLRYNSFESNTAKASFAVPTVPVANPSLDPPTIFSRQAKRKHSDGQFYSPVGETGLAPSPMTPKPLLERSPTTARILLVMALGKICQHRSQLPGPVPDNARDTPISMTQPYSPLGGHTDSPQPLSVRQSPTSSSLSTVNASAPSPITAARFGNSSPRSTVGDSIVGYRNVDTIPGLAYYAQATDILGNITGLHELIYAQCCLLAGLYAGQLANTLESLTWIQSASRICRYLVQEPTLKNLRETKKDLIRLAFWTSLQLESDILAELDIPRSGIQDIQDVAYPKGFVDQPSLFHAQNNKEKIMIYYSFQLYMRKTLNDIQRDLYQEKDVKFQRATRSTSLRDVFNDMIVAWREKLPPELQWVDGDVPAKNINDARLRGKFYGAQYIIHRPFLHAALEYDSATSDILSPNAASARDSQDGTTLRAAAASEVLPGTMGPPNPKPISDHERERRAETIKLAVICIHAAMHSTVAFDEVLGYRRMVVTNIMGTAHAQFGNMLVLSAAYRSKTLGSYVNKGDLDHLFERTIKLLRDLSPISQTLGRDCYILKCLREVIFDGEGDEGLMSSFSSE